MPKDFSKSLDIPRPSFATLTSIGSNTSTTSNNYPHSPVSKPIKTPNNNNNNNLSTHTPRSEKRNSNDYIHSNSLYFHKDDIKPVRIRTKHHSHSSNHKESLKTVRKRLNTNRSSDDNVFNGNTGSPKINSSFPNMIQNTSDHKDPLATIDLDLFEKYLLNPSHIKVFTRGKESKVFKRYILAQELQLLPSMMSRRSNSCFQSIHSTQNVNVTPMKGYGNNLSAIKSVDALSVNDNLSTPSSTKKRSNSVIATNAESTTQAIWSTKFSLDGKYLATSGKLGLIKIWKVIGSPSERIEMDMDCMTDHNSIITDSSVTPSKNLGLGIQSSQLSSVYPDSVFDDHISTSDSRSIMTTDSNSASNLFAPVFHHKPYCTFHEHTHDVLDTDWSKNNFFLSASMDKTVKLWHLDRIKSLKTFEHPDFVTCVKFCPNDDRFFISGCLDHVCRFWSIIENEVTYEFNAQDLITSISISPDIDGKLTIIATFNGFIHILWTKGLKFIGTFHITDKQTYNRSLIVSEEHHDFQSTDKFQKLDLNHHNGPRITDVQCFYDNQSYSNNKNIENLNIMVTSNDSRIRIFNLSSIKQLEVLKGFSSGNSRIKPYLRIDDNLTPLVVCGSTDNSVYAWKIHSHNNGTNTSGKKERLSKSRSIKNFLTGNNKHNDDYTHHHHRNPLKLFPKINGQAFKNSNYTAFRASAYPVTTTVLAPKATVKTLSLSNDLICELYCKYVRDTSSSEDVSHRENENIVNSKGDFANKKQELTNLIHVVGDILITTDNQGTIRIFRADMPDHIRKHFLGQIQNRKKRGSIAPSTTVSMNTAPSLGDSSGVTPVLSNNNISVRSEGNLHDLSRNNSSFSLTKSAGKRSSLIFSSSTNLLLSASIGAPFTKDDRVISNGIGDLTITNDSNSRPFSTHTDDDDNQLTFETLRRGQCTVCDGTKFRPLPGNRSGYYCIDCGSILSH